MSKIDLKTAVQAVRAAKCAAAPGHPTPDDLLAYHGGELGPDEMESVREHIACCSSCLRAVLDLARLHDIEATESPLPEEKLAQRWESLSRALSQEASLETIGEPDSQWRRLRSALDRPLRSLWTPLAALLLVALGLVLLNMEQRRTTAESRGPSMNLVIAELVPTDEAGQRSGEHRSVRLPEGASGVVLTLALLESQDQGEYEVSFERTSKPSKEVLWRSAGLKKTEEGILTLQLPRGFLPPGSYTIELHGVDGAQRHLVGTYRMELEYD